MSFTLRIVKKRQSHQTLDPFVSCRLAGYFETAPFIILNSLVSSRSTAKPSPSRLTVHHSVDSQILDLVTSNIGSSNRTRCEPLNTNDCNAVIKTEKYFIPIEYTQRQAMRPTFLMIHSAGGISYLEHIRTPCRPKSSNAIQCMQLA